jgi:hypothetical protein
MENQCTTNTTTNQRFFDWKDTLTPGFVSNMTLSVPSPTFSVVGKRNVPLTVSFKAGTFFPLNGIIIMKFPPLFTHNMPYYTMVNGNTFTVASTGSPAFTFPPLS